jgi:spectinomycin phosphotransferase
VLPGARGTVAETFDVQAASGRFFVKLVPISRYSVNIERALPVQRELHALGVRWINVPVPGLSGALSVRLADKLLIVFEFIDAEWTREPPFEAYVDLLASVHLARLSSAVGPETFEHAWLPDLRRRVAAFREGFSEDPSLRAVEDAVRRLALEIEADLVRFERLTTVVAARTDRARVLTHSDAAWNTLVDGAGHVYLVDWDDLLLAPAERDTWFHLTSLEDRARFLPLYRRHVPGYEVDESFYAYYLMRRYLEDLEGILDWISAADATPERRALHLEQFEGTLEALRRPVRALTPEVTGAG